MSRGHKSVTTTVNDISNILNHTKSTPSLLATYLSVCLGTHVNVVYTTRTEEIEQKFKDDAELPANVITNELIEFDDPGEPSYRMVKYTKTTKTPSLVINGSFGNSMYTIKECLYNYGTKARYVYIPDDEQQVRHPNEWMVMKRKVYPAVVRKMYDKDGIQREVTTKAVAGKYGKWPMTEDDVDKIWGRRRPLDVTEINYVV